MDVGNVRAVRPQRHVVVAVGDGSGAALTWSVHEALRTGADLHLVHVARVGEDRTPGRVELQLAAHQAAVEARREGGAPLRVTTEQAGGATALALTAAAADARVVVTGRRRPGSWHVDSSVSAAVATHVDLPLVTVPPQWPGPRYGVVVVGLDVADPDAAALREAVVRARLQHAVLRVVVARPASPHVSSADLEPGQQAVVAQQLEAAGADAVEVEVEVVAGHPADVLARASHRADLLVVGRRRVADGTGSRLGPIVRGVMTRSACPVLLAPPHLLAPPATPAHPTRASV